MSSKIGHIRFPALFPLGWTKPLAKGFSGRRTQIWARKDEARGRGRLVRGEEQVKELRSTIRPCSSSLIWGVGLVMLMQGERKVGKGEVVPLLNGGNILE